MSKLGRKVLFDLELVFSFFFLFKSQHDDIIRPRHITRESSFRTILFPILVLCPKQFDIWKVHEKSIWVKRSSFVNSGSILGIVLLKMVFSLKVTKNVNTTWQPALWHLIKLSYFCQIVFRCKGCWTHLIVSFQKKFLGSILRTFEEILKKPLLGGSKTLLSCGIFIKSQQRLI